MLVYTNFLGNVRSKQRDNSENPAKFSLIQKQQCSFEPVWTPRQLTISDESRKTSRESPLVRMSCKISWCSGYHICLTHRRSAVRARPRSRLAFAARLTVPRCSHCKKNQNQNGRSLTKMTVRIFLSTGAFQVMYARHREITQKILRSFL